MILYTDMTQTTKIAIGVVVALVIGILFVEYSVFTLGKKMAVQENAIKEITAVLISSGVVIPDGNGGAQINTLLLEAYRQYAQPQ